MFIDIEQHDRYCILRCKGRFVAGPEMDYMQTKMDEIKRLACIKLLADFQEVTAVGSMGVAFIVGVYTSVIRKACGRFVLVGAGPRATQGLVVSSRAHAALAGRRISHREKNQAARMRSVADELF